MVSLGVREVKTHLSELLERVRNNGETIEITHYGTAVARLVPAEPTPPGEGEIVAIMADLDALIAEIGSDSREKIDVADVMHDLRRAL